MVDTRFFTKNKEFFTPDELASVCGATLHGCSDGIAIQAIATLANATSSDLTFLANRSYIDQIKTSKAGLCVLAEDSIKYAPSNMALLVHPNPYYAYASIAAYMYTGKSDAATIHETAHIAPTASIGNGVSIGAYAVIEDGAMIGDNSTIDAHAIIRQGVVIGASCHIHSHASISHTIMQDHVVVYSGACIGKEGFGFAPHQGAYVNVPQLGRVLIGNYVTVGANTTIDRGAIADTLIGDGSRIDNLVQIAHNVKLGRGCILAAMVGISGSTTLGDYVMSGGQVGFSGHLNVGSHVKIAAQTGVGKDVKDGETIGGYPAVPIQEWHRQTIAIKKLVKKTKKKEHQ